MPIKRDFYDVLGVNKSASDAEFKAAYRKQALMWHPDRNKAKEAEEKFKEVNEAYEVLSNPEKKAAYDNYGHDAFTQGGMGGAGGFGGNPFGGGQTYQSGPFTYSYTTGGPSASSGQDGQDFSGFDFSDPFEIFEQFFGGANPFGARQRQIPHYSLTLDFLEAARGCEKEVLIEGKRKKIKIPAGVDEGSRIKFEDFYLSIDLKPDKVFKRDGADVVVNVDLAFTLAILGGEISVPTIDGELKLKIRPGTQPGTMVRLANRGIKHLHSSSRGDEYVRLNIKLPEKLSREQKSLLEKYASTENKQKGWF